MVSRGEDSSGGWNELREWKGIDFQLHDTFMSWDCKVQQGDYS